MATPTAFETALDDAGEAVQGYITTALPIVALVAIAGLGLKYVRRFVRGM